MSAGASGQADEAHESVRERVQLPAMFLTANGALNLLVALFQVGLVVTTAATPAERMPRGWAEQLQELQQRHGRMSPLAPPAPGRAEDVERSRRQRLAGDGLLAAVLLTVGVLGVAGGVRMYQARSYPLALAGSLASLVPCVSPMACCCAGELIGGWCAVVLLLPGVRAAFR